MGGKPIYSEKWQSGGIEWKMDLLDPDQGMLTALQMSQKYGIFFDLAILEIIHSAIPVHWKEILTEDRFFPIPQETLFDQVLKVEMHFTKFF